MFEAMKVGADGWSDWLRPVDDTYRAKCCDCGLVHKMEFRIDGNDNVNFRISRESPRRSPGIGEEPEVNG